MQLYTLTMLSVAAANSDTLEPRLMLKAPSILFRSRAHVF